MAKLKVGDLVRIITPLAKRKSSTTRSDNQIGKRGEIVKVDSQSIIFTSENGLNYETEYTGWELRKITNIERGLISSNCYQHRYKLYRCWNIRKPLLVFVGLNPLVSDGGTSLRDSKLVSKAMQIAERNGYGGIIMLNLISRVSLKPMLTKYHNPENDMENIAYLTEASKNNHHVLFHWGFISTNKDRVDLVKMLFKNPLCMGKNSDGSPINLARVNVIDKLVKF